MRRSLTFLPWRAIRRAALVAMACSALACDAQLGSAPPPASCSRIGAQCQLPGGPLGVCQEIACDPGAAPPCFTCTAQH